MATLRVALSLPSANIERLVRSATYRAKQFYLGAAATSTTISGEFYDVSQDLCYLLKILDCDVFVC